MTEEQTFQVDLGPVARDHENCRNTLTLEPTTMSSFEKSQTFKLL